MSREALSRIREGSVPKGDVLALAEAAGVLAAKRTPELLPLCHSIGLDSVCVKSLLEQNSVLVRCEAIAHAKTGVEMEALSGASAALLCIYDLIKGIDSALSIGDLRLEIKEGGKSGTWRHPVGKSEDVLSRESHATQGSLTKVAAAVITVSDRCSRGEAEDLSGPAIEMFLGERGAGIAFRKRVPDELEEIQAAVRCATLERGCHLVVLTGGTGVSPRDVTPEALEPLWRRKIPGVGELLRSAGASQTPRAWLSRSEAGLVGDALVILLPGSARAVYEGLSALEELLPHAIHIAHGGDHR